MTKENAKDFLPLVQAIAEGKTIQHYYRVYEEWRDADELCFNDKAEYYRIKPDELWYVVQSQQGYEIKCSSEFETDPCREFESSDKSECEKWITDHKPQYVPFDSVEELIECWNKKYAEVLGLNLNEIRDTSALCMPMIWVKAVKVLSDSPVLITKFLLDDDRVIIDNTPKPLNLLFESYTFLDGTPIGKIKE